MVYSRGRGYIMVMWIKAIVVLIQIQSINYQIIIIIIFIMGKIYQLIWFEVKR